MSAELHYRDAHVWTASFGQTMVTNWFGTPNAASARAQMTALAAHVQQMRPGVQMLTVTDAGVPLADEPTRAAITGTLEAIESRIEKQAMSIEGEGFGASALRAMVAGMTLVVRAQYPIRIFADVPQATAWIAPQAAGALAVAVACLSRELARR